jgi:hypothetical protein
VNQVHPAMMAAIAADHIKDMREDAVRDGRARAARRARRAGHWHPASRSRAANR